jgi:methylmalonyl-CoA mutase N-terminal domain/subunit
MERRQIAKLKELRQKRDSKLVAKTLADLTDAARANENLMPALIEAVKAYATTGEICDTLRVVYGLYEASQVF